MNKSIRKIANTLKKISEWCKKELRAILRLLTLIVLIICIIKLSLTQSVIVSTKINIQSLSSALSSTKDMKYILLWTPKDSPPFDIFGNGTEVLFRHKCPVRNCYFTDDKYYFGASLKRFNAIMFNGWHSESWYADHGFPKRRYPHQKYIYAGTESAPNKPICTTMFYNFFNWTYTYRLDSDCPIRYFTIKDDKGTIVGPKEYMHWKKVTGKVQTSLEEIIKKKTKTAAWFVSNCYSKSNRNNFVEDLQKSLKKYNLTIDVYGGCGELKCLGSVCDDMIKNDYLFYMALENSFDEDYVTEKVLHGLNHYAVPVVYGGANYSRFLPPNSYLDGRNQTVEELAATMHSLVKDPSLYSSYFSWKSHYRYSNDGFSQSICQFCELLNSEAYAQYSVYQDFRSWWNPNYKEECVS